jgi:hypothetical protein
MLSNDNYQTDYVGIENEAAQTRGLGNLLRSLPHLERQNYMRYYDMKHIIKEVLMSIFINTTWGKALLSKVLSKVLKKKGFNARVKLHDFKIDDEGTDCLTLKLNLEVTMKKEEIDKLVETLM